MHELPSDAARLAVAIAGDPMANVPDAAQLLDIEMQQLPGPGPFVSHDPWALRERVQAGQADLRQCSGNSGPADLDDLRNLRAGPAQLPQALNLDHDCRGAPQPEAVAAGRA